MHCARTLLLRSQCLLTHIVLSGLQSRIRQLPHPTCYVTFLFTSLWGYPWPRKSEVADFGHGWCELRRDRYANVLRLVFDLHVLEYTHGEFWVDRWKCLIRRMMWSFVRNLHNQGLWYGFLHEPQTVHFAGPRTLMTLWALDDNICLSRLVGCVSRQVGSNSCDRVLKDINIKQRLFGPICISHTPYLVSGIIWLWSDCVLCTRIYWGMALNQWLTQTKRSA